MGAYAQIDGHLVALRAMLAHEETGRPLFGEATGKTAEAQLIGRGLV